MTNGFISFGDTFSISISSMFGIAFLFTLVLTPVMRKLALKWRVFDHPNRRKMHSSPVPYFGGVAMFCGFFLALALLAGWDNHLIGFALGALIMLVVGMIDDLINISPVFKLLGQTVAALVMVSFGVRIEYISNFIRGTGVIYLGIWSITFFSSSPDISPFQDVWSSPPTIPSISSPWSGSTIYMENFSCP